MKFSKIGTNRIRWFSVIWREFYFESERLLKSCCWNDAENSELFQKQRKATRMDFFGVCVSRYSWTGFNNIGLNSTISLNLERSVISIYPGIICSESTAVDWCWELQSNRSCTSAIWVEAAKMTSLFCIYLQSSLFLLKLGVCLRKMCFGQEVGWWEECADEETPSSPWPMKMFRCCDFQTKILLGRASLINLILLIYPK